MKTVEPPRIPLRDGQIWPLTVAAYRSLGEAGLIPKNTELLYGFVYKKMSKSPLHSSLVRRLLKLLRSIQLPGRFVSSEQPITCGDSEPEPDVAVVCGVEEDFWLDHPNTAELVIEVSLSSHEYDRSKLRAYAEAGIKEVWFVLGPEKKIEAHWRPMDGQFSEHKTYGPGGRLVSIAVPEFTLDLEALFAK